MRICEFLDWESLSMSLETFTQLKYPFHKPIKYHIMLEVESNLIKSDDEKKKSDDPGLTRLFSFVGGVSDHMIVSTSWMLN